MPLVLVALLVLSSTAGAALLGRRIGRRLRATLTDQERTQLYTMQASLLGLLALLLGFSFSMSASRYDARRLALLEEANAIGTARLRASAIPDDPGRDIERLLSEYLEVRLSGARSRDDASLRAAVVESERLQRDAWARASALARREPQSLPASLLLQSLNTVIELHTKRVAMGRNHIPGVVLFVLLVVALVAMTWVGTCVGTTKRPGLVTTLVLSLLISTVIMVIVDMDQPRRGLIRVNATALLDLEKRPR